MQATHMPHPDALQALAAVEETGSISAAAARRHVSQPALSRQLQGLARDAGVPLLERRGRRVALLPAGVALAGLARRQAADWRATLAVVGGRPAPLRLGCGATVALTLLPAALAAMRAARDELTFHIVAGDSATTVQRLLDGEVEAGVVTTAPASSRRLAAVPIARDPVVAVGPAGGPAHLRLADLAAGPLCLYARGTGFRQFVDELFGRAGLHIEPAAEMDSLEAVRELAAAGLGRSLLPRSVAAPAVAAGRLRLIVVEDLPRVARTVRLLRRSGHVPHHAFVPLAAALRAAAEAAGWPAPAGGRRAGR